MSILKIPAQIPIWEIEEYLSPQELKEVCLEIDLITKNNLLGSELMAGASLFNKKSLAVNKPSIFFEELYGSLRAPESYFGKYFDKFVFHPEFDDFEATLGGSFLYTITTWSILFAQYNQDGFYRAHRDGAKLTLLFWYTENPNELQGGDLFFPDINHTVVFKSNKAVIFPSFMFHEVTPVTYTNQDIRRYSFSVFMGCEKPGNTIYEHHRWRKNVPNR